MSKIKVLVLPSDRTGVSYFRSTKPHIALEELYPNEFHVDIEYEADRHGQLYTDEWLKQYDIIHYHRTAGAYERVAELLDRCDKLGIVTIMDLDDYWAPGPHHPGYLMIKNSGLDKLILNNIKTARNLTTTTSIFAQELGKHNNPKNIFVLPNAIDPTEKQFVPKPEPSDKIRIGWLGGSSHLHDLQILKDVVGKVKSHGLIDKVQFVLCGFDLRGTVTIIDEKTKESKVREIKPHESVWTQYEKIFTDDYSIVSPEYKAFLLQYKNEEFPNVANEPYRRVWTKPISTYASNYNLFDVSLAPLEENIFNKVKSQLKVIEAGFHKKAIIAQDFGPYQIDLVNGHEYGGGWNENGNGILIDSNKNHKDWFKFIKKLIDNPALIEQLSTNLHNSIKDKYSIETVSAARRDLYLDLLSKKRNQQLQSVATV